MRISPDYDIILGLHHQSGGSRYGREESQSCSWLATANNLKELQQFLGFANFYRRFIRGFSSVASPLTPITKRSSPHLTWSTAAQEAFTELKSRFTSAPILHHPDPELLFIVEVDASNTSIGAILSQRPGSPPKLYPCAYYSHKLNPAEQDYDDGNWEWLAMKSAMEEGRHWLKGSKHLFLILTDHKNFEYLRYAKRLNPRQTRWALVFTLFDFTVTYHPGSKNTKADALSRQHDGSNPIKPEETLLPESLFVAPIQWDIMTELAQANSQENLPPNTPLIEALYRRISVRKCHSRFTPLSAPVILEFLPLFTFFRTVSDGQPCGQTQ